jgi:two-component system, chemotaxis family, protein-glutamate methylesterase/glutaminase
MTVRVLIVDDSAMMRSFLREVLSADPEIEVVGVANDPFSAREKIKLLNPSVITLDVEMPGMDGLTFLEHLMRLRPMPVVMVSSRTQGGAATTVRALEIGAVDFVAKPTEGLEKGWSEFEVELVAKVKSASQTFMPYEMPPHKQIATKTQSKGKGRLVALGGSTGSIAVLQHIISEMPADAPAMLVVVHMPAQFTKQFAARLNGLSAMTVVEAEDGMSIESGHVYIAPGDKHMTVKAYGLEYRCQVQSGPRVSGHIPSVDVLFNSLASVAGRNGIGIILTGMGKDGALGLKAMRDAGATTACQNRETSLIFGMPGSAIAEGAVCDELALSDISEYILTHASALASNSTKVGHAR